MRKTAQFLFILFYALQAFSQKDTTSSTNNVDSAQYFIKLKELVISEFHNPKSYSDNTRTLFVIPVQTIKNLPASNLNDVIENISTVDIRRRGTGEVQSDLNIRGGSFEQSLILLNGIPVNDPQTGHHNLDLPLTKYDIERIEILYGPGAELYGPNSFNGAVNIITYSFTNTLSAKIYSEGGSYNTYTIGAKT
jgi:iron complex outermembrane receptor protein